MGSPLYPDRCTHHDIINFVNGPTVPSSALPKRLSYDSPNRAGTQKAIQHASPDTGGRSQSLWRLKPTPNLTDINPVDFILPVCNDGSSTVVAPYCLVNPSKVFRPTPVSATIIQSQSPSWAAIVGCSIAVSITVCPAVSDTLQQNNSLKIILNKPTKRGRQNRK